MPFGPFALQWHPPTPNPPETLFPLPTGISRSTIPTPSGPLELLTALPSTPSPPSHPPLFFAHGGFGCAAVWLSYMQYFAARGYACYAVSYRGHGASWYPGFWRMYCTTRGAVAGDLVAGIRYVEGLEARRRGLGDGEKERVGVVLVAHSAGAALGQYVLSRGMVEVEGFCILAGVPGFGSFSCYSFWMPMALVQFPYRAFHPRYVLANTHQVQAAFFTVWTPASVVRALERILSPYESMLWPLQGLLRFVTGPDVLSSITGWAAGTAGVRQRLLVLAAEHDVLCTPKLLLDAAKRYRSAFRDLVGKGGLEGVSEKDLRPETEQEENWDGVRYRVVKGLGHHLQNHVEWERGAEELLEWVEQL